MVADMDASDGKLVLPLRVKRASVVRLIAGLGLANLLLLAGTWLDAQSGGHSPVFAFLLGQLNVRTEGVMAVWYSSMLILLVGFASLGCFVAEGPAEDRNGVRPYRYAWLFVAFVFAALSLDELGVLHERIGHINSLNPFFGTLTGWVGVLALPGLAVALFLAWFFFTRLRNNGVALVLVALGLGLLASVPFQEELEAIMRDSAGGRAAFQRPIWLALVEEGTELFGTLSILAGIVAYLPVPGASHRADGAGRFRLTVDPRTVWRVLGLVIGGFAVAMALVWWLVPHLPPLPWYGAMLEWLPFAWFPAVLCLLVAGASFYLTGLGRTSPPESRLSTIRYGALGVFALLVSLNLGANLAVTDLFWDALWPGSPRRQLAVDIAFMAVSPMPAILLWSELHGWWRVGLAGAVLALASAVALEGRATAALIFIAFAILLLALGRRLVRQVAHEPPREERECTGVAQTTG